MPDEAHQDAEKEAPRKGRRLKVTVSEPRRFDLSNITVTVSEPRMRTLDVSKFRVTEDDDT